MNRKNKILAVILICILICGVLPAPTTALGSEGNLVQNPGFENGQWQVRQNGSIDTEVKHSGNQSVKFVGSEQEGYWGSTGFIAVDPDKSYELSVWIKTDEVSTEDGAFLQVQQMRSNYSNIIMGEKWIATGGTQDWTQYTTTVANWRAETAYARIYVKLDKGVTGTVWFDDVVFRLIEIEEPEEPVGPVENLVRDPGFETGEWQLKQNGSIDTEVKNSGNQSVRFAGSSGHYGTHPIEIDLSRSYELSVWIKTDSVSSSDGAFIHVQQMDASQGNLGLGGKRIATGGTQDWTEYKITISSWNSQTKYIRIYVRLDSGVTGAAWFDDVVFVPVLLELSVADDNPTGNIYVGEEDMAFNLALENYSSKDEDFTFAYTIKDYEEALIAVGTVNATAKANTTTPVPIDLSRAKKFGTYKLEIEVRNNQNFEQRMEFYFSRILTDNTDDISEKFGMCTHYANRNRTGYGESIPLIAQTGAGWIRDEMYWSAVEYEKGKYRIPPDYEAYVQTAVDQGLNVFLILNGNHSAYGSMPPSTEESIQGFANYAAFVAEYFSQERFKGRVTHFEIWNEYNIPRFNLSNEPPATYAKMIKAAYAAIKAANPEAFVVGGCTARVDLTWLRGVFDEGGLDYMDAVSVHPYSYPSSPDGLLLESIQRVHNLIREYDREKPVWASEYGYPTHTGSSTERESAYRLTRAYVLSLTNDLLDRIMVYVFEDNGTNPDSQEDNFGLVRHPMTKNIAYSAKEAYVAHTAAIAKLNHTTFVEENSTDNVRIFKFQQADSDQDLLVVWAKNDLEDIGIETDSATVLYSDLMGNPSSLYAVDGIINFTAGKEPIYLEGSFPNIDVKEPIFRVDQHGVEISIGGSAELHISATTGNIPAGTVVKAELPMGWMLQGNTEFGSAEPLRLTVPESVQVGEYSIVLKVEKDNQILGTISLKVEILPIIASRAVPSLQEDGTWEDWNIDIELKNTSDVSISGQLTILSPAALFGGGTVFPFTTLLPGAQTVITIPVSSVPKDTTIPLSYRIDAASDNREYSFEYGRDIGFLAAVKAWETPEIDGIIEAGEWDESMEFHISRYRRLAEDRRDEEDLSARGWVKWDDEGLYIAVEAIDDQHNQSHKGTDIWRGDSIQMGIDTKRLDDKRRENIEIGFALTNGGSVESWSWTMLGGTDLGSLEQVDVMIVRNESEKTTTYEIAIPWTQLIMVGDQPTAGDVIGFSMLVNDNDTGERKGYIEYMTGIGGAKAPQLYGDVLLIEMEDTTPEPFVNAVISPTTTTFDVYRSQDVSVLINWGSAQSVVDVVYGGDRLAVDEDFAVSGERLSVRTGYFEKLNPSIGDTIQFEISFDVGVPAVLEVEVVGNVDVSINPQKVVFDLYDPNDVKTIINWGSAQSVVDVVYGAHRLTVGEDFTVSSEILSIHAGYLASLNPSVGDIIQFEIIFDVGEAVLTVEIGEGYIPGSDASLKELTVGGSMVDGFVPNQLEYYVELPYGTIPSSTVVMVGAIPFDQKATLSIIQVEALPGTAIIEVTAEDGTQQTYQVYFTLEPAVYRFTISAGSGGRIVVGSSGDYTAGTVIAIEAVPNSGYSFRQWTTTDGDFAATNNASTTFTMPEGAAVVTAEFIYNGSSSDADDSSRESNSSSSPAPEPIYRAKMFGEDEPAAGLAVTVDKKTGSLILDLGDVAEDIFKSKEAVAIHMPSVDGVSSYSLIIPADVLDGLREESVLTFAADIGSITIPNNMLAGTLEDNGKKAEISMKNGDKSGLSDEIKKAIGDRPLIHFSLTLDGEQVNWNNPDAAIQISIPYTPTSEELEAPEHITVWYIDGSGNIVPVTSGRYNLATGLVTFETTHFSDYGVVYVNKTFHDLSSVVWAKKPIEVLASKGILKGTSEKEYMPQADISRADFLYFLIRTLGVNAKIDGNFEDIQEDSYYYKEIAIAKKLGIATGIGNNEFSPDVSITRQDMMVLTERALRMLNKIDAQGIPSDLDKFDDKVLIADYAVDRVASIVKAGLIIGDGVNINPLKNTTRAETAVFLYRLYHQ